MANVIARDAHPAAPPSPTLRPLYEMCIYINTLLTTEEFDAETRAWLITERGRLTGDIWRIARNERVAA